MLVMIAEKTRCCRFALNGNVSKERPSAGCSLTIVQHSMPPTPSRLGNQPVIGHLLDPDRPHEPSGKIAPTSEGLAVADRGWAGHPVNSGNSMRGAACGGAHRLSAGRAISENLPTPFVAYPWARPLPRAIAHKAATVTPTASSNQNPSVASSSVITRTHAARTSALPFGAG